MKTKLGQHFLVSAAAQQAVADAMGDLSRQVVVEIGPGQAAITDLLVKRTQRLIAVELDDTLARTLRLRFARQVEAQQVEILHQDILTVDLYALARNCRKSPETTTHEAQASSTASKLAVVGNLPYYITSDILLHLFAHSDVLSRAVLMVQKEVADRIVATPGTSDYGMLSATCQLYARVERLLTLPPEAFSPPPQVHSSVVRLTFAPRFQELGVEPAALIAHLRQCFAQKRKTLANNLRAAGHAPAAIALALERAGIPALARSETLTLEEQAKLCLVLNETALHPQRAVTLDS